MTEHQDGHADIQKFWQPNEELYAKIFGKHSGNLVEYFNSAVDLEKLFKPGNRLIMCIDEGTQDGIHAAGSLILVTDEEAIDFIKKSGAVGITSHEGCGAARLVYCHAHGIAQSEKVDPLLINRFAMEYSQHLANLAREKGVWSFRYNPILHNIASSQMRRPSFHDATAVYIDYTGQLNNAEIQRLNEQYLESSGNYLLPKGFQISARYHSSENALKEVGIALSIALGSHGFGERFTQETPFLITVIDSPDHPQYDSIKDGLHNFIAENNGRVIVNKVLAPAEVINPKILVTP